MTNRLDELLEGVRQLGSEISENGARSLIEYLERLEETNKSLNLTRIPPEEYVRLHLLDSLTCLPLLGGCTTSHILDIGTGAGFPGVPLAAALPTATITLLDSTLKKLRFVDTTARECGILNCAIVHTRAEAGARAPELREAFDVVVSRAVAPYRELIELMLPYVRIGGIALAMKGSGFAEEMAHTGQFVGELGGQLREVKSMTLPGTEIERHLILIEKVRATPRKYPRTSVRADRPSKAGKSNQK